jgi:hypothetical protein
VIPNLHIDVKAAAAGDLVGARKPYFERIHFDNGEEVSCCRTVSQDRLSWRHEEQV